jgi:putative PIN family toxin of toxin-antitoxin system
MRIILDTNILVSVAISKRMRERLTKTLIDPGITIIANNELLEELQQVLQRPKMKRYLTNEQIESFLVFLGQRVEIVEVTSIVEVCRDPKDDYLLGLCKDGQVDYLISGDQDVLALKQFEQTKILTFSQFLIMAS